MAGEWLRHDVSDLIANDKLFIGDGYRAKNDELAMQGLPFARAGNINEGFRFDDADFFPEDGLTRVGNKISQTGDVVFTSKGTVGRFALVRSDTPRFVYSPQLCFWRSLDLEEIHPRFLYYWLCGPEFYEQYKRVAGQTDMAEYVSLSDQRNMSITLPGKGDQHAIADILGSLDDKIELNRRMNTTLEEMARAIYKSWFVDFDPVHAKARGEQPSGMDTETAALFPDSFEESGLGTIPAGWEVKTLGQFCSQPQYGFTASAQDAAVGPKFLRIKDINKASWINWERVPYCEISESDYTKYKFHTGDILIARMADPGHGVLIEEEIDGVFASYLIRFRPVDPAHHRYLQYWLRSEAYWRQVEGTKIGTTRSSLNAPVLGSFRLTQPPKEICLSFSDVVSSLRDMIVRNNNQSCTLAEMRDALLPNLISGEVRVGIGS